MAKMGRPKLEHSKRKVLSIRIDDELNQRLMEYTKANKTTVTEVVLQELKKLLNKPE